VPAPPVPTAEYDVPASWKEEETAEPIVASHVETAPEIVATPMPEPAVTEAVPEPEADAPPTEAIEPLREASEPRHPQFIPVFKQPEPVPAPATYDLEHTSAPPTGEMEIPREPALQERVEDTTRSTVADHVEPGLLSTIGQQMETRLEHAEISAVSAEVNSFGDHTEAAPGPAIEVAPAGSESAPMPEID